MSRHYKILVFLLCLGIATFLALAVNANAGRWATHHNLPAGQIGLVSGVVLDCEHMGYTTKYQQAMICVQGRKVMQIPSTSIMWTSYSK